MDRWGGGVVTGVEREVRGCKAVRGWRCSDGGVYWLGVVEFLLLRQVFGLQQVVSDRSGLDGVDQVQDRQTAADGAVLHQQENVSVVTATLCHVTLLLIGQDTWRALGVRDAFWSQHIVSSSLRRTGTTVCSELLTVRTAGSPGGSPGGSPAGSPGGSPGGLPWSCWWLVFQPVSVCRWPSPRWCHHSPSARRPAPPGCSGCTWGQTGHDVTLQVVRSYRLWPLTGAQVSSVVTSSWAATAERGWGFDSLRSGPDLRCPPERTWPRSSPAPPRSYSSPTVTQTLRLL